MEKLTNFFYTDKLQVLKYRPEIEVHFQIILAKYYLENHLGLILYPKRDGILGFIQESLSLRKKFCGRISFQENIVLLGMFIRGFAV